MNAPASPSASQRWQRFMAASLRAFHTYARWLVSISWKRFVALALGLLIVVALVHDLPPFTWTIQQDVVSAPPALPPLPPAPGATAGVDIDIGNGAGRITTKRAAESAASAAASAADSAEQARQAVEQAASAAQQGLRIALPPGPATEGVQRALEEAQREIEDAVQEAKDEAQAAGREAADARREASRALKALDDQRRSERRASRRTTRVGIGDLMMQFTLIWIVASAVIKFTYKGRVQAEVKAAQATETAEAESLRRQVVEARMAAMQAQVEPHFLFNTLASIDHLIETDPPRASTMQKNLIALLRASMPSMRETGVASGGGNGVRELGRELAVIRPYLEILKVRMEERLTTELRLPDGLLSAEFPPMMIQTLVENAIKHGLEPKAEGGALTVAAEIVHGKLQVTVADTGLGFGKATAATAGTGVGLANIRERLQLLYGSKAALAVAENSPSGTVVTITVPYRTVEGAT